MTVIQSQHRMKTRTILAKYTLKPLVRLTERNNSLIRLRVSLSDGVLLGIFKALGSVPRTNKRKETKQNSPFVHALCFLKDYYCISSQRQQQKNGGKDDGHRH